MDKEFVNGVGQLIKTSKKIVVTSHKNPDGDAMGSAMALYLFLWDRGKDVKIIMPNEYPNFLKWMPSQSEVLIYENNPEEANKHLRESDVIFTLDYNDLTRSFKMQPVLETLKATFVMIDHHLFPKTYATFKYSDSTICSTCELVYNFINTIGKNENISKDIATCIYTGILTDTGSFNFLKTSSQTHRIVADLIDKGADNITIATNIYNQSTISKVKLLGVCLNRLIIIKERQTAYSFLTRKDLYDNGFQKGDAEGFVNHILSIKGVKFAVIFIESMNDRFIKISLRSLGNFNVNKFSNSHFNGGGHFNAAGGKSEVAMKNTIAFFIDKLKEYPELEN